MSFPATLVVGATGRIGRVLQRCWGRRSADVLWQSRSGPATPATTEGPTAGTWAIFDPLHDGDAYRRAACDCDVILCLAGVIPGRGADLEDNVTLAEAAIRVGAATGARVLLASSAAVYGNQPGCLDETAALCPQAPYGVAKARMEARGAALGAALGATVSALRIGNIAGLDAILGGWRPGFALDVLPDGGTPQRSYIGMGDLAQALGDVVAAEDLPPALNIAAPGPIAMGALLDAAGLAWTPRPAPDGVIARVELDPARLAAMSVVGRTAADPSQMVADWRRIGPHVT